MKIELKNVSYSARLSEETSAFTADVWIDGKKAGYARNHGTGGDTDVGPRECEERLTAYGKTLGKFDLGDGLSCNQDAGFLVDQAFEDWLVARDLKKLFAKGAVVTLTDKPGIFTMTKKGVAPATYARAVDENKGKCGVKQVLNVLPWDEALKIFRAGGK